MADVDFRCSHDAAAAGLEMDELDAEVGPVEMIEG